MLTTNDIIHNAWKAGVVVPAFNVPYLPMVEPITRAIVDQDAFALIEVARAEWTKGSCGGLAAIKREFDRCSRPEYTRVHLDHVPVIDEDGVRVDHVPIIRQALDLGYESVMVDGSRLPLAENIAATREAAAMAHGAGAACEAELGLVMGREAEPLPPYEELYNSGRGFTDVAETERFVSETGCDWLSVAVGNVHGAITAALKDQEKVEARLDLNHLERLQQAARIPFVLHGGSRVLREFVLAGVKRGSAKMNIGTEIRQAYERGLKESERAAQQAAYERVCWALRDYLGVAGCRKLIAG